jgi:hypothetical protein
VIRAFGAHCHKLTFALPRASDHHQDGRRLTTPPHAARFDVPLLCARPRATGARRK